MIATSLVAPGMAGKARGCLGLGTERDRMDAGPPKVPTEDAMFSCLLLSAALTLGQTPIVPDTSGTAAPAPPAPSPPADRWLLMKSLQGTWPGWLLDSNRLSVYGWTDMTFTASSDAHINLP